MSSPKERLDAIVEQGLCIGCGLCQAIAGPEVVSVEKVASGYERPVVLGRLTHETVDVIYDVCPGTRMEGLPGQLLEPSTSVDPVWGPWRRITRAWAGDPNVRFEGSTGGVLTALGQFLLTSGRVSFVLHATASTTNPSFGERTISFTHAQVLDAAGSRYGPTATLIDVDEVLDRGEPFAVIAKPCDVTALRNYARHDNRVDELVKYWLTMVCGGFATPDFTNRFLETNGIDPSTLTSLRYRGRGCPGPTVAEAPDQRVERHYLDYWGDDETQWSLPWRCKICPDGIGEASDLAVSDTWPGGSPDRVESEIDPGVNAIIARTVAGQELMEAAEREGVLVFDGDLTPEVMNELQPHQRNKKLAVGARHAAIGDAGRIVPATARLRVEELSATVPVEINRRQREGTLQRIDVGKASEAPPERIR
ncbi:MAG: coenzyme F420 hydrogenase [Acidimicrobiales bacterium]|nr:coenzyme F420 hydrogenase [Acidimicrobiales bacterium]RZV42341.1 MAG: coenzyme F420 hydrogenase [Acidimicrobiales bacterium]